MMSYLEVMDKICPTCPYNKNYRIGIKCTKLKEYPYLLNECPRVIEIEECWTTWHPEKCSDCNFTQECRLTKEEE